MTKAGSQIGPYRIVSPLGSGGMGEVYRAHDSKLGRDVAIKFLPATVSGDPNCRMRFEREARMLAALQHPRIAMIFGVEETGSHGDPALSSCAIVMELVEGATLAARIANGHIPEPEALSIAKQIVDAVSAAHLKGIVHRDLKPANVVVTDSGDVKILDFGLATAMQGSAIAENARTQPLLTGSGAILGTAPYMSPEQVRGQSVDQRTDIWAFGCVLYEMLTGKRAFDGDTAVDVMAATLDREPDWRALPASTPSPVRRLLKRCLEKDLELRLQDIGAARADLDLPPAGRPPSVRALPWLITGAMGAAVVVAVLLWARARSPNSAPGVRPPVSMSFSQLTSDPGIEWFPSLSPDGKWIAYASDRSGNRDIFLQGVTGQTAINLTADSADDDDQPAFSPDGERIAFRSSREGGGIFVMGRTGESVKRLTRSGFRPAWSPDGAELVYTTENVEIDPQNSNGVSELWAVSVSSAHTRRLGTFDAVLPSWSPHGFRIAYTTRRVTGGVRQLDIWTVDRTGRGTVAVTTDGSFNWNPVWSPDGQYLYFGSGRGGPVNLWRIEIDEVSGKPRGQPEPLTTPTPFIAHLTMSADGRLLAYSSVQRTRNVQRLAINPLTGASQDQGTWLTSGSRTWSNPDPSPDGQRVAFYSSPQPENLYIVRSDGSGLRQITSGTAFTDRVPRWSPDGRWIAFFSNRTGGYELWKIRPDGSDLSQLTAVPDASFPVWSPDGSRMAVTMTAGSGHPDNLYVFDPNRPWAAQTPDVLPPFKGRAGPFIVNSWSPDGLWLAGFDGLVGRGIVTYSLRSRTFTRFTDDGGYPVWLPDSRHLLFVVGGKEFRLLDTTTNQVRRVFSVQRDVLGPAQLSRDGHEAYFTRRVTEADVWLATLGLSGSKQFPR